MKRASGILAAAAFVLAASTSLAYADPITIGTLIVGGLSTLGVSVPVGLFTVTGATALGQAAITLAVAGINLGVSLAMRQKPQTQKIKNTIQGQEGPGLHAFGRVEIEGRLLYGNTSGLNISRLIGHAFGELERVETYYYDGRELTVEADGYVSSPPWSRPPSDPTPSYMRLRTKVGDGTETAWDTLVTDFSAWTVDHRVQGIAQTLMRIESPGVASPRFAPLLQGGVKATRLLARMLKPYDPRTALNTWTMNGVLHTLHYLRALNGITDDDLDFSVISTVATEGEVQVPTLSGTKVRCQLSGGWEGPITTDIVADMMESAGIELYQTDDSRWAFRFLEDYPDSEITLTQKHIIDNYPQAGPESGRRPNVCKLTYFSPERRYERAEIDLSEAPWARVQDEIDAYGDQEFPCDLTFCCDASQAQRIARRMFLMARADAGVLRTNWSGMAVWGKRTGTIEIPDVGPDGASEFVRVRFGSVRPNDADGTCEIPYVILPDELATPWDAATMEVAPPPVLIPQQAESDLDTPLVPYGHAQVQYPSGGAYEVRVGYVLPIGGTQTEAVYRIHDGESYGTSQSMTEVDDTPDFAWSTVNLIGENIDFRVRIFNADGDGSYFSPALEVPNVQIDNTAPGAPTVELSTYIFNPGPSEETRILLTIKVSELNVVRAVIEFTTTSGSSWSAYATYDDVRPGSYVVQTTEQNAVGKGFRVRLYTSDLTPGTSTGEAIVV